MQRKKQRSRPKAVGVLLALAVALSSTACAEKPDNTPKNGLAAWGQLSVKGTQLCAEDGTPAVLRGMSSHGLIWYPEYTNYRSLKTIRDFGANVFRIAVYPDQKDGYLERPELNEKLLYAAVENALAADLYVIVDWHVLRDENPLNNTEKAVEFFDKVAKRYRGEPGILYEICNEPNGNTDYRDITEYAQAVIPVIRKHSPNAVILVGTPKYCTTLEDAVASPLPYINVMYSYHFYSDISDCRYARGQIDKALENGVPVFISEWGYGSGSGTQADTDSLNEFMDFLENRKISWVNWSLSNKDESYSFIPKDNELLSGWTADELSPSGKYVVERLNGGKASGK